jgi:hypothetical protein
MARYRVLIDDNFHFMDESHRYEHGVFDTAEEAIAACRAIVDSDLEENYSPGMSPAELYLRYQHFGEDPFVVPTDSSAPDPGFSAWNYAKERSEVMCARKAPART